MSSQSPRHQGHAAAGPSNQRPLPSKHTKPRSMRADFLLGFHRPPPQQRSQAYAPPARRGAKGPQRSRERVAFVRGRFVQSAFRLFVEKGSGDVIEAALNADELVDWPSVCRVDLLCDEHPKCPICLEQDLVVPKVTRCGHIFCLPCIMRYFIGLQANTGKYSQGRCPVCSEQTSPEELTSVRFQMTRSLREGMTMSFLLVCRQAHNSTIVRLLPDEQQEEEEEEADEVFVEDEADELRLLPMEHEAGWHFSRLVRLRPGEFHRLVQQELEALQHFRPAAIQAGDTELLPSIDAGVRLLQKLSERLQTDDRGAAPSAAEPRGVRRGPPWSCSYVEVPEMRSSTSRASEHGRSSSSRTTTEAAVAGEARSPHDGLDMDFSTREVVSPLADGAESPALSCGLTPLPSPELQPSQDQLVPGEIAHDAGEGEIAHDAGEGPRGAQAADPGLSDMKGLPPAALAGSSSAGLGGGTTKGIVFYQASDGRTIFLEPFFQKLLVYEHDGWENLPAGLANLRMEKLQDVTVTEDLRKRHKFIAHLPLGSQVTFAHVDLRPHLSKATKDHFSEEFKKRRAQLRKEQTKARKEEREGKHRTAQEEERYYQSLNLAMPATMPTPPTREDFVPLPGHHADEEVAEVPADGGEAEEAEEGPTLAAKIKDKMIRAKKQEKDAKTAIQYFPALGASTDSPGPAVAATVSGGGVQQGGSSSASGSTQSKWGPGFGSSRVKGTAPSAPQVGESPATATDEGPRSTADEVGQALAGALESASVGKVTESEQPEASTSLPAEGSRKKKGRAGKGVTVRLFG